MIVIMGSGAETVHETVDVLVARGEKVGVLKVRLYRPFSRAAFLAALPRSARAIAVLDRTKEPGALGDPLYLDVMTALAEARADGVSPFAAEPQVVAGRYGLSSKEFTPAMVKAVFDELGQKKPRRHFTIGIVDDVTHTSLTWDPSFRTEGEDVSSSVFYGLGADGTVGANKNSIKIIGQETERYVQGYFVYDSKKSGAITVSHLRSSPRPIRSAYLVDRASFVACHQFEFVDKIDVLEHAAPGAVFLLNAPASCRGGLGPPAPRDAGADGREAHPLLRDRRLRAREEGRDGRAHQHHHADLLLRHLGHPAPRGSDRAHQEVDREDLRQARAGGGAPELRGGGPGPGPPARGAAAEGRQLHAHAAAARLRAGARLRAEGHGGDAGRQGRPAAGERLSRGRHLADGHGQVGEAQPRARDPGLGLQGLHPVQPVRARLPARGDPGQGLRRGRARRRGRTRSSRPPTAATSTRASSSRSRWRRRTAPAATCA